MKKPVYLMPIGEVEEGVLGSIAKAIERVFDRPCRVGKRLVDPIYAYDRRRRQYLVGEILSHLRRLDMPQAHRLLGLVDQDCYTPGLNFVFGQAMAGGRDAVVALPRLRQEFYGLPEDEVLFKERAIKEAVHELGHTYGLGHCPNSRCVMHFSNSLADTDIKGASFCRTCRGELDEAGL